MTGTELTRAALAARLRRQALEEVAAAADAVGLWHRPVVWGETARPGPGGWARVDGEPGWAALDALRSLDDPYPFGDVAALFDEDVERFVPGVARWRSRARLEATELHGRVFGPLGVVDEARLAVEDDGEVIAVLSLLRRRGAREFQRDDVDRLAALVPSLGQAFVAAHRIERDLMPADPGLWVLDEDGAPELSNGAAERWLALAEPLGYGPRTRCLPAAPDAAEGRLLAIGPGVGRCVRRQGVDGRARFLVEAAPPASPPRRRAVTLTSRQREIAQLAAHGATVPEIAQHLGLGRETVRAHLKEAYRRLGVSNRAELVKSMDSLAPASSRPGATVTAPTPEPARPAPDRSPEAES